MNLLERYEEVVGHQEIERLRRLAERLAGKRIVHVNSTRTGGGVAEILGWMIPLMQELGIDARWEVIDGNADFYRVTKAFHNGIQGLPVALETARLRVAPRSQPRKRPAAEPAGRRGVRPRSAADLLAAVHARGPGGPLGLALPHRRLAAEPRRFGNTWRAPCRTTRRRSFRWPRSRGRSLARCLSPPSIDPLSDKNCPIPEPERLEMLARLGIDPERPMLLQVSRFDRFKDPLGVIEAYRLVKPYYPEMQLVLAGGPADDDPEGAEVLREVLDRAGDDKDLKV